MDELPPGVSAAMITAISRNAEAVDRGTRSLAADVAALRETGLLASPLEAGNARPLFDALVALGGASMPLARLYEGHVDAVSLVARLGTSAQIDRVAADVRAGVLHGVWGAGGATPARAVAAGSCWRLSGEKRFCSGLGLVGRAVVTAQLDDATTQLFLIDADDPERHDHGDWDVVAMTGSASGRMDLSGMTLAASAALGARNAFMAEPEFHGGLWRIAAMQSGALQRLVRLHHDLVVQAPSNPLRLHRHGCIAVEAGTALLWSRHAMEAVMPPDAAAGDQRTALLAREAVEQSVTRALALMERDFGTRPHRRCSEAGRIMRDLRFHLRQADPDGKLAYAVQLGGDPVL